MKHVYYFICFSLFFLCTPWSAQAQSSIANAQLLNILKNVHQNNPGFLAAKEEFKETLELYPEARAGWRPRVNAEASVFTTDVERNNFGSGDGATTKDFTLSVDQPLWRGGQTFSETARAKDLILAGEAILERTEQAIFIETITAYMNIVRDQKLMALRHQNERILLKELHAAQERMDIGDATDTDIQQARTRVSRARSNRIQATMNLNISQQNLEALTGIEVSEVLNAPYENLKILENLSSMLAMADRNNPEITISKFEHSAAQHTVKAAFREFLPQASAFASFNRQYDPQPGIVNRSQTKTIGVRATLALYQGGAGRSKQRKASRAAKRQEYRIQETHRRVKQAVTNNWRSYQAAIAQTKNRQEEILAAERALSGIREEARMGQRTILDILDADEDVIEAKIDMTRAHRDEVVRKFTLASSIGLLTINALTP